MITVLLNNKWVLFAVKWSFWYYPFDVYKKYYFFFNCVDIKSALFIVGERSCVKRDSLKNRSRSHIAWRKLYELSSILIRDLFFSVRSFHTDTILSIPQRLVCHFKTDIHTINHDNTTSTPSSVQACLCEPLNTITTVLYLIRRKQ